MSSPLSAEDKARKLRILKIHAIVFAAVVLALAIIDWMNPGPFWFQWVLLGWGLGVAAHAALVARRIKSAHA